MAAHLPTPRQILRADAAIRRHKAILRKAGLKAGSRIRGKNLARASRGAGVSSSQFLGRTRAGVNMGVVVGAINFDAFDAAITKYQIGMPDMALQTFLDYTEAVFLGVISLTPILTAQARNNWHMSRGSASTRTFPGIPSATGMAKYTTEWTWGDQVTPGRQLIQSTTSLRDNLWINNNLAYIELLDSGAGSPQAPAGMFGPTLLAAAEAYGGYVDAIDNAIALDDLSSEKRGALGL